MSPYSGPPAPPQQRANKCIYLQFANEILTFKHMSGRAGYLYERLEYKTQYRTLGRKLTILGRKRPLTLGLRAHHMMC